MSDPTNQTLSTPKRWRTAVFMIVAALAAFGYLIGHAQYLLAPWMVIDVDPEILHPETHRWHDTMWGSSSILVAGSLITLLWRPHRKPLLAQYLFLTAIVAIPFVVPFVIPVVPLLLVVAAYPNHRALLNPPRKDQVIRPLLALSVAALVVLLPVMLRNLGRQLDAVGGEHAVAGHWISDVEKMVLLLLAGFLASTGLPGWRPLAILIGITYLYLGLAALLLPDQAGSWGIIGGILALFGGLGYIALMWLESRKLSISTPLVPRNVATP